MKLHFTGFTARPRQIRIAWLLWYIILSSILLLSLQIIDATARSASTPQTGASGPSTPAQIKTTENSLVKDLRLAEDYHRAEELRSLSDPVHIYSAPVEASIEPEQDEDLHQFITTLINGKEGSVRGAYVPDVFALPVIQQPEHDPLYVVSEDGFLTQYQSAADYGVTGLIAHNYLSGASFSRLEDGMEVRIIYGDGTTKAYEIDTIREFQKVSPTDLSSDLIDLATGDQLTSSQVFQELYSGGDHVTFQTCLEKEGNLSWGLLFVVASPLAQ